VESLDKWPGTPGDIYRQEATGIYAGLRQVEEAYRNDPSQAPVLRPAYLRLASALLFLTAAGTRPKPPGSAPGR